MTIGDLWSDIWEEASAGIPVGSRIDALTATAMSAQARARLMQVAHETATYSAESDIPVKRWTFRGNAGFQKGSVRHATCPGYSILMVTGEGSQHAAAALFSEPCKWTRIDLATDVQLPRKNAKFAQLVWSDGKFKDAQAKRGRDAKIVQGMTGDTLYVGKRTSGRYFRLYDKSASYGEEIGAIWRYEVELKKYHPERLRGWLFEEGDLASKVKRYVHKSFNSVGLPGFDLPAGEIALPRIEFGASEPEAILQWIRTSVRPPVQRLIQQGLLDEVLMALDVEHYVERRKEYT